MERDTRRGALRAGGGLLAACLAGCTGVGGGDDETHGYGGQAMLVTLETAATRASGQGSEPSSFADADCP